MKHKIATLCVLVLAVAFLVLAGTGLSQAEQPRKATGGVGFTASELDRFVSFEVHGAYDDHPVKGMLNYRDANKDWYKADIQCATFVGEDYAFFAGPVVSASQDEWLQYWVFIAVYDGGTPGSKGDIIWGEFRAPDTGCRPVNFNMFAVEKGNLVVH